MAAASPSLEEDQEFHAWKLKYNKVYSSPDEEAQRKLIWLASRSRILAHNLRADQGLETYHCGLNHLSDMKLEEICCCRRGPKDQCDSASNASNASSVSNASSASNASSLKTDGETKDDC